MSAVEEVCEWVEGRKSFEFVLGSFEISDVSQHQEISVL